MCPVVSTAWGGGKISGVTEAVQTHEAQGLMDGWMHACMDAGGVRQGFGGGSFFIALSGVFLLCFLSMPVHVVGCGKNRQLR